MFLEIIVPNQNFNALEGRIETITLDSAAIANNILGDPTQRQIAVYLPAGYDHSDEQYPLLVDIVGFTSSGLGHIGWKAFAETVPQRVERLISEGRMGKVVIAFPDCFTSLGGNQYINSSVLGNWADFLTIEMLPELESRFRLLPGAAHRGLFGKSSGGYGAIAHAMKHGEHWGAIACHSGDMAFELAYLADFPKTLMQLARYGGSIQSFMNQMIGSRKISGNDMHTLMILAMAATYDPAPELPFGVRLPVSSQTCELNEALWQRWLAWDPVRMVEDKEVQTSLKKLKGIFIDCGSNDQYALVFGARRLASRLVSLGITHTYDEFSDNHSSVDYRMDVSLPFLYDALSTGDAH
ncbi:MAG: enterochelin esterase-like enzyme [Candidatus Azotimanducaceae bacterium]